ncbi:MAG: HAD-IIB family hydrolase [Clostridia bacterium]|nr:HAD-IIB family hydrolase [Clostridia bacterium]
MNNKSYSDWLIVSDIDGTLNNQLRQIPKVNKNAIYDFVHNKGGHFTLASGRGVQSLEPHFKNLPDVNTPAIVMNGAGIYDYNENKMLWFNPISNKGKEVIRKSLQKFSHLEIGVITEDMIYLVRPRISGPVMMMLDSLRHKKVKSIDDIPDCNWGKVIFFTMPHMKKKVREFAVAESDESLAFIDTSSASFDLVAHDTNKGTAVLKLAEILGISEDKIGTIGNYYNDLDMLKAVKHSACCKQAPRDMHPICEYVTCHCNDGAVADFINYIYKTY